MLSFGVLLAIVLIFWLFMVHANREEAHREVAERADEQHAAIMRGDDPCGTYGDYPPDDLS